MTVTIGPRTSSASSLKICGCSLSGQVALLGFKLERRFLTLSFMISKGSIWGSLGEASFMGCFLSWSRDSGGGSEKTDLNWLFSMVAFFLLPFSSFPLLLVVQALVCLVHLQSPIKQDINQPNLHDL